MQKGALYCSKACNNKVSGAKRTAKNKKDRQRQSKDIELVLSLDSRAKGVNIIKVAYEMDGFSFYDSIGYKEFDFKTDTLKRIKFIDINGFTFTNQRALFVLKHLGKLRIQEEIRQQKIIYGVNYKPKIIGL